MVRPLVRVVARRNHSMDERNHEDEMKPLPAPPVPGNTDAERMDNAVRTFLSASKEDHPKEEDRRKRARVKKKRLKAR